MKVVGKWFVGLAVLLVFCGASAVAQKWQMDDVMVGTSGGKVKVLRPSTGAIIDTLDDTQGSPGVSSPGATAAAAIDSTWHLLTADPGAGANQSNIVRFRISPNELSPGLADVLSTFSGSPGGGSVNAAAIAIGAAGQIAVGNATNPSIAVFSPAGALQQSFALTSPQVDRQLAGLDLSADGTAVFYTSGGSTVRKLQLGSGAVSDFAVFTGGYRFYGIRVIPAGFLPAGCSFCPAGESYLVAAQDRILLLDSAGAAVAQYTISGQRNLRSVTLTPLAVNSAGANLPITSFWAAGPNSGSVYRVDIASGSSQAFATGASAVYSLATYGGFGANQPVVTRLSDTISNTEQATLTAASPTAHYVYAGADKLTITGFDFPAGFSTTLSVAANTVVPSAGATDDGWPCTPTIDVDSTSPADLCAVWKIQADPPLPSPAYFALSFASSTPNALDLNTRVFRNERQNVTASVRNDDPSTVRSTISTYSMNQVAGNDYGCYYFEPVHEGADLTGGNVTFRISCTGLTASELASLLPRISIVEIVNGSAPQPFFPDITDLTGGTCCTVAYYRFGNNSWIINVDFPTSKSGSTFRATTFFDNVAPTKVPRALEVQFTYRAN